MSENVLKEAERLIFGDREDTYGDPSESFARIANLWTAYTGKSLDSQDVANMMILLKVSRAKGVYHRDSFVDIAGYAGLAERLHNVDTTPAPAAPAAPRRWWKVRDIPLDVEFRDRDHDYWINHTDSTRAARDSWLNEYAPFDEVLGG